MKYVNFIIELLTSPFTLLFRTNVQKNANKEVRVWLVFLLALLITAGVLFAFYYKELLKW